MKIITAGSLLLIGASIIYIIIRAARKHSEKIDEEIKKGGKKRHDIYRKI